MVNPKFYFHIIVRIILIIGLSIVMAINLFEYEKLFTVMACGIGIFLVGTDLLRYTTKMNKELLSFFEALKYEDHSFGVKQRNIPGFKKLSAYMNDLNKQLTNIKIESEVQAQYLDSIIEHIQIGLLAVHPTGEVEFCNSAAQKILQVHRIKNINTIREKHPEFGTILQNLKPGAQKLVKLHSAKSTKQLSLRSTTFRSQQQVVYLYSFQNVAMEIEETEIETWKKLIRVLTHEINNSITPIHSLSDSLKEMVENNTTAEHSIEQNAKVTEGLEIIRERSMSLLDFVEKFRSLTPKGKLNKETFSVHELLYKLKILMSEYYTQSTSTKIFLEVIPNNLQLKADQKYLEQIMINLIKNAIEATQDKEAGRIEMKAFQENGNTLLQVKDNGEGISREDQEKIFIPFYTTKKTGSGIGLSLSRQIMKMHGGSISVHSEPNQGTLFTLKFETSFI